MASFVILITTSLHLYDEREPMKPILDTNILQKRQEWKVLERLLRKKKTKIFV
jgi:hypothetical protein